MSKNIYRRIKKYVEIARALKPGHQTGQYFHVTIVCKKRKVLAIGINDLHKLNIDHRFGPYTPSRGAAAGSYKSGIHSEVSALIKLGREDCSDLDFYNIRINNLGLPAASKPCHNCQRVLRQVGYKNIYYFDENGNVQRM